MKDILSDIKYAHIHKMILEFTQKEVNQIFQIGNTVTFYVKDGGVVHPVKIGIIPNRNGEEVPNIFYAKSLSQFPINLKEKTFVISDTNQDIRTGKFEVDVIGKTDKEGKFIPIENAVYTFNNIFKVESKDNTGKLINTYYANDVDKAESDKETAETDSGSAVGAFLKVTQGLKQGDCLVLMLNDNSELYLDYIDTKGGILQLEPSSSKPLPSAFSIFKNSTSVELDVSQEHIKHELTNKNTNKESELLTVKARSFHSENGEVKTTDGEIIFKAWDVEPSDGTPSDDETGKETADDVASKSKEMMDAILNDPLMKKAFYRQPTLWNLIVSAVKGKNPRGTGIGPAWNIVNKYGESKVQKSLGVNGKNFKAGKQALFELMYEGLEINPTSQPQDTLVLSPSPTKYRAMVNSYKVGGDDRLTLENKKQGYKIRVLKPYKEEPDTFEVSVIKIVEFKSSGEVKEYPKSAIIHFINENGSGYSKTEAKTEIDKTQIPKK